MIREKLQALNNQMRDAEAFMYGQTKVLDKLKIRLDTQQDFLMLDIEKEDINIDGKIKKRFANELQRRSELRTKLLTHKDYQQSLKEYENLRDQIKKKLFDFNDWKNQFRIEEIMSRQRQ